MVWKAVLSTSICRKHKNRPSFLAVKSAGARRRASALSGVVRVGSLGRLVFASVFIICVCMHVVVDMLKTRAHYMSVLRSGLTTEVLPPVTAVPHHTEG